MKKFFKVTIAVVLAAFVMCAYSPANVLAEGIGRIAVNGQGKISVAPDMATMQIGVQTEAKEASAAQQDNARIMENVLKALKDAGIDEKDIKTASYYLNQKYDYVYSQDGRYGESVPSGYTVSNYVKVTLRDLDKIGNIIDITTKAGANASYGLNFSLSNPENYYNQALTSAIANARDKAGVLARALGATIGMPSEVSENSYSYVAPIYAEKAMYDTMSMAAGGANTPIELGQIEVTAQVSVVYEYPR